MTDPADTPSDLDTLTWGYLDGDATPAQVERLEQQLLESEPARRTFVEHSQLHAMLHDFFRVTKAEPGDTGTASDTAAAINEQPTRRRRKRRGGKSSAA